MVAIFAGAGFGFGRGSGSVLGASGILGAGLFGRRGEGVSVNAATGNLVLQDQDEFLVGRGPDALIARTYNSLTSLADDNNDRWRQSTDRRVYGLTGTLNSTGSTIKRVSGDGTEIIYTWDAARSAYVTSEGGGAYDTLAKIGANWVWTDGDSQTVETYDATTTKIISVADINGNALSFAYDGSGRLSTVTTANGEWTRYDYSGSSQNIVQVVTGYTDLATSTAKTLTRVRYGYDASNRLSTVTVDLSPGDNSIADGVTYLTTYSYDTSGRVSNIAQSDGSNLAITYDGSGRVSSLTETASSGVLRVTTLTYGSGYTDVTDPAGQVTRLNYDANNQLTQITAPPAYAGASQQVIQFGYNANGDVISVTDALGKVTSFANFTANGLAQTITDTLGNTTTRTFDSKNNKLSESFASVDQTGSAVSETVRYVYDSLGNLRFSISPEGSVQEWVYSQGAAIRHYTYTDDLYTSAGNPTEAQLTSWKAALSDASLVVGEYLTYDTRQNLSLTSRFGLDNANGTWSASKGRDDNYVVYSQAGELLSTINGGGTASTVFAYDGMGRVTAATDINGGTTTYAFADSITTTTVTMASGYVVTKTYNKSGELIAVTDSGANTVGGTTSYVYDKLGRVRVSTDAAGLKTYTIYDSAGRHVGDVDNDGNLVEFRFDANNRLVGTIQYHAPISTANLTALGSESTWNVALSAIRPATNSQDTASWVVYDSEGRVLETIAGDGSATVSIYDASGRLQQTTAYFNKIAQATVSAFITGSAPTSVVAPLADASRDLVARNFYDKDGRLVGKLDGEGYLSQNVYDKAGRLVTTTTFANQVAQASRSSSSFNTLIGLVGTSADDRVSHFVYDSRSLLRYQVDEVVVGGVAKGRVSGFYYNNDTDSLARTVVYDGYMAATSNYKLANIETLTAALESSSGNRVTFNSYDSAGRLAYTTGPTGQVTSYKYDSMGKIVRLVQFATARAVSAQPLTSDLDTWSVAHLADSGNRITRSFYTARGEAAYVVDGEGYASFNNYDAKGQVVGTTRWANAISVGDTTTLAQVAAALNSSGGNSETQTFLYDSLGRVTRATDALGNQTTYIYHGATSLVNSSTRAATGTAQEQSVSNTVYDAAGRAIQVQGAVGSAGDGAVNVSASTSYDGRGFVAASTDARGNTTSYTYDLDGRVKSVTNAVGGVTNYIYNAFGQVWQVTDPNGNVTSNWYDKLGRVIAVQDAQNFLTTTSYTIFGEIASVTRFMTALASTPAIATVPTGSGTAATTTFVYDKMGRVTTSTDALGNAETFSYDAMGNRSSVTNKLGGVTSYGYDRIGRLTRQGTAAASSNYPATGNYVGGALQAASATAGVENVTTFSYDGFGNLKQKVEGYATTLGQSVTALRTTGYSYNANNQIIQVTHDAVTTIADDMVTLATATPSETYVYDKRGNVIVATDAAGAATYSYYDDLDRKTVDIRQLATNLWVYSAYAYDAAGNLVSTKVYDANPYATGTPPQGGTPPAAPAGTYRETGFSYDALGRMLTSTVASNAGYLITSGTWNGTSYVTGTGNLVTTYEYDADGNVVKLTDANGNTTWSWYDKLSRKTAQLDGEGYLTKWVYNAEGSVTQETRFAAKFTGTPSLGTAPSVASGGDDRITQFTYDLNGNRISEIRLNVTAWTVDPTSGTLAAASTTNSTITYTYNALGQVVKKTQPTGLASAPTVDIATYAYDNTGRLASESRATFVDANGNTVTPTTSYGYDAIGELITTTQAGTSTGTYQALNRVTANRYGEGGRLLSTTDAEGYVHQYFYDVAGRLKKDAYSRIVSADNSATNAATTTVAEAKGKTYDLSGRVLTQSVYSTVSGSLTRIDFASYQYNNFDQVTQQGSGSDSASGINAGSARFQIQNQYDAAGRLIATNSGDGVWKYLGYDKLGNQTIAITSAGYALNSGTGFAAALSNVGLGTLNATYTVYDKRNMAAQVVEEGRDLSATLTNQTLTTSRSYNAFGEIASETNALGAAVSYTYNTMGRRLRSESPAVETIDSAGNAMWIRPSQDFYYDLAGRMIATRDANGSYPSGGTSAANATSKAANTGNLTAMALLAGTGYDGKQGLVATEFHADGGKKQTLYDVMGDARVMRDEMYSAASPNLHITEQSFNRLGLVTTIKHNRATNVADDTTRLIDNYVYDQLGQRIQHTNNLYGAAAIEKTAFDALGRTTAQTDMAGNLTATSYAWDGTLTPSGLGALGGWAETTQYYQSGVLAKSKLEKTDLYGRFVTRTDLGGHVTSYGYNTAGQLITSTIGAQTTTFAYYNTGQLASNNGVYGLATYSYDAVGNRLSEKLVKNSVTIKDATSSYDALGRLISWNQAASATAPLASLTHKYDANGNILRTIQSYSSINSDGALGFTISNAPVTFQYDSMNRLLNEAGKNRLYDANGRVVREFYAAQLPYQVLNPDWPYDKTMGMYLTYYYTGQFWTNYNYNPDGTLASVTEQTEEAYYDDADLTVYPTGVMGSAITRSSFTYDKLGRATAQTDYSANGITVVYSRSATFNAAGQITWESTSTRRDNGSTYGLTNSYGYGSGASYALGSVVTISSTSTVNGGSSSTSSESTSYAWYDAAVQSQIDYTPNTSSPGTVYHSYVTINALGQQSGVNIQDGRPRTVSYVADENGQILRRDEVQTSSSVGPHEVWYRFGGKQMAFTGNNYETGKLAYGESIAQRTVNQGTGMFRDGRTTGSGASNVDFSQTPDAINSYSQGSSYASYTVRQGDSLQGIAQTVWGDASLWYKLAEANGLSGSAQLSEGQNLILPAGVRSVSHNAATFKPYNQAEALGDITPSAPKPPKKNNCGVFGMILIAVVAIAVTVVTAGAVLSAAGAVTSASGATGGLLGGMQAFLGIGGFSVAGAGGLSAGLITAGAGAIGGMVGSAVSQGVGVATGLQDKFSFGAVAMAGIGGLVGGGVTGVLGKATSFGGAVVRGALSSAITQGVGVATGLQDKFSWAGVAAAGVGSGVGMWVGDRLAAGSGFLASGFGNQLASSSAAMLANAATRSAIEGSDFGDNLMAGLPDMVAGLVEGAMGRAAAKALSHQSSRVIDDMAASDTGPHVEPLGDIQGIDLPGVSGTTGNAVAAGILVDQDAIRTASATLLAGQLAELADQFSLLLPTEQAVRNSAIADRIISQAQAKAKTDRRAGGPPSVPAADPAPAEILNVTFVNGYASGLQADAATVAAYYELALHYDMFSNTIGTYQRSAGSEGGNTATWVVDQARTTEMLTGQRQVDVAGGVGLGVMFAPLLPFAVEGASSAWTYGLVNAGKIATATGIAGEIITGVPLTVPVSAGVGVAALGAAESGFTARAAVLRDAFTDASGNKLLSATELRGLKYTIRGVESQGFRLTGAIKYSGNQGIDLAFEGVGSNVGRYALAEGKASKGLASLSTDALGIRQGSEAFFATRLERAGRIDLRTELFNGNVDLYGGFSGPYVNGATPIGRLFQFDPTVFTRNENLRTTAGAATRIDW